MGTAGRDLPSRENKLAAWRRACFGDDGPVHVVQDHERCLWQDRNLTALALAGCPVVVSFPKSSPDLNAIEGWWRALRERLEMSAPEEIEARDADAQLKEKS